MNENASFTLMNDFERDARYAGHGYLLGREAAIYALGEDGENAMEQIGKIDAALISQLTEAGVGSEQAIFAFVNSKFGRWFADAVFAPSGSPYCRNARSAVASFAKAYKKDPEAWA